MNHKQEVKGQKEIKEKIEEVELKEKVDKQEAQQAISGAPEVPPPHFIAGELKKVDASKVQAPETKRDEVIAEGVDSDFWRFTKAYIEKYQLSLKKNTSETALRGEFDLNRIGMSYLLNDQISSALQAVIDFVENKGKIVEIMKKEEIEKKNKEAELKKKQAEKR